MQTQFTIEEFRTYVRTQDSLGDVLYNLTAENVQKANRNSKDDILDGEFYTADDVEDDLRSGK